MLFYANPYASGETGFEFSSYEEFVERMEARGLEEFEIECLDGPVELFNSCGVDQNNIGEFIGWYESVTDSDEIAVYYLTQYCGNSFEEALRNADDVFVSEGSVEEYAENYVDECGLLSGIPDNLRYYFDYEAFGRDMEYNGGIYSFRYNGIDYVVSN